MICLLILCGPNEYIPCTPLTFSIQSASVISDPLSHTLMSCLKKQMIVYQLNANVAQDLTELKINKKKFFFRPFDI